MLSFTEPVSALVEPLLTGYMFKQSHVLDVFNKRFFVLYPGYLVYYVKLHDWHSDVTKNTLQVSAVLRSLLYGMLLVMSPGEGSMAGARGVWRVQGQHASLCSVCCFTGLL